MRLKENIRSADKEAFFDGFFAEFSKLPFGSMSKRDIECLLINLLYNGNLVSRETNREAANALGINEKRLSAYILDARYKFVRDEYEKNTQEVIRRLCTGELKLNEEGKDFFSFGLENPVWREDFSKSLKDLGFFSDGSFNAEVVKVSKAAFLALLLKQQGKDQTLFKRLSVLAEGHEKELLDYWNKNTAWRGRAQKCWEYVKGHPFEIIQTLLAAAALIK